MPSDSEVRQVDAVKDLASTLRTEGSKRVRRELVAKHARQRKTELARLSREGKKQRAEFEGGKSS
jgi:hypothetical protein